MSKGKALSIPVPGPGRKSLYREQYAEQAFKLCLLGAKDEELADFFGVTIKTLFNWRDEHPAFLQACIDGKVKADGEVAHSLYKMATGHHITAEKLVKKDGGFEAVRYKQYIPGDSAAAYRWLLNRRRQDWTDKQVHEHTGTIVHEHREAAQRELNELFGPTPHEITLNA
jgi:hypothetical protein